LLLLCPITSFLYLFTRRTHLKEPISLWAGGDTIQG
jgi:hypothetical protein